MTTQLDFGGTERQITQTAKFLDPEVFEVHVGCLREGGMCAAELKQAGIPVMAFPLRSFRSAAVFSTAGRITRYIREHGIRLVHTWDYPLNCFGIPVTRLGTSALAVASQRSHRGLIPAGYRRATRTAGSLAHAWVVNCDFLRRHLIQDEHIQAAKIHVCHNGIDLDRFHPAIARGQDAGRLVIGIISVLRREKDIATLIRAFGRLHGSVPEAELVIVGSGDEVPALKQCASETGVSECCRFEPPTAQVAERLSAIDIFVLPSRSEAFSNSLMEAMACGCCPVASNVGGNPELVRHGETGLLFKPGDADGLAECLRTLAGNPELRARLAANARRLVCEEFSIGAAARRMGLIYSELLASHQPAVQRSQEA